MIDKGKSQFVSIRARLGSYISTQGFDKKDPSVSRLPLWFIAGALQRGIKNQVRHSLGPGYLKPHRYPKEFCSQAGSVSPDIEALIVIAGKDFDTLPANLINLQKGSENRIKRVTLVTPSKDLELCKSIVSNLEIPDDFKIQTVNEDEIFDPEFREELKTRFQHRYGWVLQQLLTTKLVLNSSARGVLVVDADTILLKPRLWLTEDGIQPLLVSVEFHSSYYKFLSTLGISKLVPADTHVTHHMLMQPQVMREIFQRCSIEDVETLGRYAIEARGLDKDSPVCLEYEVYAQGMVRFFPERVRKLRFSNTGVAVNSFKNELESLLDSYRANSDYFSISLHTYLRAQ